MRQYHLKVVTAPDRISQAITMSAVGLFFSGLATFFIVESWPIGLIALPMLAFVLVMGLAVVVLPIRKLIESLRADRRLQQARQVMPFTAYLVGVTYTVITTREVDNEANLMFETESGVLHDRLVVSYEQVKMLNQYLDDVQTGKRQVEGIAAYLLDDTYYISDIELFSNIAPRLTKAQPSHKTF